LVVGTVRADAFCHNMVRAMVGAVMKVGSERQAIIWPYAGMQAGKRFSEVAPAFALTLEQVTYPPPPFDEYRATAIRAKRSLT
jgi:tRNA pseudouridine38-40 synthase